MMRSFFKLLLTMAAQYVMVSTLISVRYAQLPDLSTFWHRIFQFFAEAVPMGMTPMTGNALLIKKVYTPKYIYPFSKPLSLLINFGMALFHCCW